MKELAATAPINSHRVEQQAAFPKHRVQSKTAKRSSLNGETWAVARALARFLSNGPVCTHACQNRLDILTSFWVGRKELAAKAPINSHHVEQQAAVPKHWGSEQKRETL